MAYSVARRVVASGEMGTTRFPYRGLAHLSGVPANSVTLLWVFYTKTRCRPARWEKSRTHQTKMTRKEEEETKTFYEDIPVSQFLDVLLYQALNQ